MAAQSKTEYLKRYISKGELPKEDRKKKKRKIKSTTDSKLKIIDDDLDFKKQKPGEAAIDEDFNEEAPTVAEIIDERPKHIQQLEQYRKSSRWKVLGDDEDKTSGLDYGIIPPNNSGLQGSDSEGDKGPSRRRHDTSDSDSSPRRTKPETYKNTTNKNIDRKSQRHDSDSDTSPIRKNRNSKVNKSKDTSPGNSPPRKKPQRSRDHPDSDTSPPRNLQARNQRERPSSPKSQKLSKTSTESGDHSDSDNSPPRRGAKRHDSESDSVHSPHGKGKLGNSDSDQSPPRKLTEGSGGKHFPPRRKNKHRNSDSDQSPPRKLAKSGGNHSPPRRKNKHGDSSSDQSPPRKLAAGSGADQSPPRRRQHDSDNSDQSPPRKKQTKLGNSGNDSQDRRKGSDSRHSRYISDDQDDGQKKATKTLGGAKAGLSSAKEMREEAKKLRDKEDRSFRNIGDDKLGKNAKTVVRDKETGKKKDLKAEEAKNEEETKKQEEQLKKYQQWGKGLKQQAIKDSHLQDHVHEASKPLARFKDDKDLDEMLRREERLEDPMLDYIRKKKEKEEQKSGKKKPKELPRYKGPAPPPNRYNLQPGYRWDGVDRSNGFEKKIFASQANKKAIQEIAYKWSTEDM